MRRPREGAGDSYIDKELESQMLTLLQQNTELTEHVAELTREVKRATDEIHRATVRARNS
jgi:hypothetical protein